MQKYPQFTQFYVEYRVSTNAKSTVPVMARFFVALTVATTAFVPVFGVQFYATLYNVIYGCIIPHTVQQTVQLADRVYLVVRLGGENVGILTAQEVKNAQPKAKTYYLSDGEGLMLEVRPNGAKYWVCRVYIHKKETRRGLGSYPEVSLKEARELAHNKKSNPKETALAYKLSGSFDELAKAYCDYAQLSDNSKKRNDVLLRCHILPVIGSYAVKDVTDDDISDICNKFVRRGNYDTAIKVKGVLSQIFKYAKTLKIVKHNPVADVELPPRKVAKKHYSAVTGAQNIGGLMRAISGYRNDTVRCALLLAAYTFCRPAEIANAEWSEIDFDKCEWIIPAKRMKLRQQHYVPLSRQVMELLQELKKRKNGRFVFYSARTAEKAISPEALRAALRIMGYTADEMTAHGFRSVASTVLNEYNWHRDVIELQLAHGEQDAVRGAYNRAQHIEERKAMVQWYADYLDAVRDCSEIPSKPTITIRL